MAVIGQRQWIDLHRFIPLVVAMIKQVCLIGGIPIGASADQEQVALLGGKDGIIPIDNVQRLVGAEQQIARVDIGVA